jgi:hypothetical protein
MLMLKALPRTETAASNHEHGLLANKGGWAPRGVLVPLALEVPQRYADWSAGSAKRQA